METIQCKDIKWSVPVHTIAYKSSMECTEMHRINLPNWRASIMNIFAKAQIRPAFILQPSIDLI